MIALTILIALAGGCTDVQQKTDSVSDTNFAKQMTRSLVYIDVSSYEYSQSYPWKRSGVRQSSGYGCAVGPAEILTTARNVIGAEYIKVKWDGQTEYVRARVKAISYESDLCLLELDKSAIQTELRPVSFHEKYRKNAELHSYWISSTGTLLTGRGYLDSAKVQSSAASYVQVLNFMVTNPSATGAKGKLFCMDEKAVAIASWSSTKSQTIRLIPAETINSFLTDTSDGEYKGFGAIGFEAQRLVDPALRKYLKLTDGPQGGMVISDIHTLGTGCDVLKKNDVVLAIDGNALNAYGRFEDRQYGQLMFHHLITSRSVGDTLEFDIWRDGKEEKLEVTVKNFTASDMLVPYYEYGQQPEFIITGGFVFQKLTRPYMATFGDDMKGSVPPHLYNYYGQMAFKPVETRKDVVLLSFVLPAKINLGYHNMRQAVVSKFNGMKISTIGDIIQAQKLNPDSKYDIVEFEQDYPTVVIDRSILPQADARIAQLYGVSSMSNVRP
jgi:S1-C subfamily serine protease